MKHLAGRRQAVTPASPAVSMFEQAAQQFEAALPMLRSAHACGVRSADLAATLRRIEVAARESAELMEDAR